MHRSHLRDSVALIDLAAELERSMEAEDMAWTELKVSDGKLVFIFSLTNMV